MSIPRLAREQVIAYRVAVQGLHREAAAVAELGVLDLGVQEAMGHPASVIFAARVADAAAARNVEIGPGCDLALAWTFRGAPHVHRRRDLDAVARALWPLSEADAQVRINVNGPAVARDGISALDQFGIAVRELRAVVEQPMVKGTVSGEVTRRLPPAMQRECRPCGTAHISDSVLRAAAPVAGLELEPGTSPPVLLRRARARQPTEAGPAALAAVASAYLTYLGPAGDAEVAGFVGARRGDVKPAMPKGLVEVEVDGARRWLPTDRVEAVPAAPPAELTRLLGPFDPYLQSRDRDVIVPDPGKYKALWPVLGRPGAVLHDGEIVGTWRTKRTAKKLTITVETFGSQPASLWPLVQAEAERIAVVRGAADVTVVR